MWQAVIRKLRWIQRTSAHDSTAAFHVRPVGGPPTPLRTPKCRSRRARTWREVGAMGAAWQWKTDCEVAHRCRKMKHMEWQQDLKLWLSGGDWYRFRAGCILKEIRRGSPCDLQCQTSNPWTWQGVDTGGTGGCSQRPHLAVFSAAWLLPLRR